MCEEHEEDDVNAADAGDTGRIHPFNTCSHLLLVLFDCVIRLRWNTKGFHNHLWSGICLCEVNYCRSAFMFMIMIIFTLSDSSNATSRTTIARVSTISVNVVTAAESKTYVMLLLWKGFESLVVGEQNADIADTLQLWNVTMATTFWLSIRYDFGCVIARCLILGVSFRGWSCHEDIARIEVVTSLPWQPFLAFYIWGAHWRQLANTTEPSMCSGDAALC